MRGINLYDSINIKGIRSLLSGKVIHSSPQELQLKYSEESFFFIYQFGCLVFFNMPQELVDQELSKLKAALGSGVGFPTTEMYQVGIGNAHKVEFEHVEIKKLSLDPLHLIALTLGQSVGLEYFELTIDRMLYETSNFMQNLSEKGRVPLYKRNLVRIIGSTASTRQQIISNLAILDPPEETWKSKELEAFYKELQQNFEIDIRFRTLDRKLTLIQDNIEILSDLVSAQRSAMLETLIAVLIVIELLLLLFKSVPA